MRPITGISLAALLLAAGCASGKLTTHDADPCTTCEAAEAECGALSDNCGGTLDCGSCELPATCGGGGVDNMCGQCTPDCTGKSCGEVEDCGTACGDACDPGCTGHCSDSSQDCDETGGRLWRQRLPPV